MLHQGKIERDEFDINPILTKEPHVYKLNMEENGENCVLYEWIYKDFRFSISVDLNNPGNSGWYLVTRNDSNSDGYDRIFPDNILAKIRELLEVDKSKHST